MISFDYKITNKTGLHARPAGLLVKTAQGCSSEIYVANKEKKADAKRLFAVIGLNTKEGDTLSFSINGQDEKKDKDVIESFCKENL